MRHDLTKSSHASGERAPDTRRPGTAALCHGPPTTDRIHAPLPLRPRSAIRRPSRRASRAIRCCAWRSAWSALALLAVLVMFSVFVGVGDDRRGPACIKLWKQRGKPARRARSPACSTASSASSATHAALPRPHERCRRAAAAARIPVRGAAPADSTFPVHRIYCVGRNFAEHAREMGAAVPASTADRGTPVFFLKPADAIVLDGVVPYPPRHARPAPRSRTGRRARPRCARRRARRPTPQRWCSATPSAST